MAKPTGFIEYTREEAEYLPKEERVANYSEFLLPLDDEAINRQSARCMDCGIPFCHGSGCPVLNRIPEFNDLVYRGKWQEASDNLHSTNNFPEITGRVCPAPCEASCTLAINDDAVTIKHIEFQIVERAWKEGWVKPQPPKRRSGAKVAVVGSGPGGMAAAQQLARYGHDVTLFEKDNKIGGLLRYGIPDFKLDKHIIDRRLRQMAAEGVAFETGVIVGEDISPRYLQKMFDSVVLTMGAGEPRNLVVPGRGYEGIHYAMDFLAQQNKRVSGEAFDDAQISAKGKNVVVIGGGDTGSDCVGTSNRQAARSVTQLEIMPQPPEEIPNDTPWPTWPRIMRTSTSHKEGCRRLWSTLTKQFTGTGTRVTGLDCVKVEWDMSGGPRPKMKEIPGSEFHLDAELVLLAMGFVHVVHHGLVEKMELDRDPRGNLIVDPNMQTSRAGVFAAGDTVSGASLVVRAIYNGRQVAHKVDQWLRGF
ncbi:MAG: glutamate synthase subunit beta [Phycisphaerae bacterium]